MPVVGRRSASAASAALEPFELDEPAGEGDADAERRLAASAVSGREPPAGPQWLRRLPPVRPAPLAFDKPLCASLDGFTLHAATRAAALDAEGREALLRYVLRPPIAQERVELRPDGLVRIALERAYADGTVAVDMDPLALLCRLAASVPPPRFHTVKYAGVLASASAHRPARSRIAPRPKQVEAAAACGEAAAPRKRAKSNGTYWPWADLLRRTLALDVLECPSCKGRMKLVAMVTDAQNIAHYLTRPRRAHQRARAIAEQGAARLVEHRAAPQGPRARGVAQRRPPRRRRQPETAGTATCARARDRARRAWATWPLHPTFRSATRARGRTECATSTLAAGRSCFGSTLL